MCVCGGRGEPSLGVVRSALPGLLLFPAGGALHDSEPLADILHASPALPLLQVLHFSTNCPECNSPADTNMKLVRIL